MSARCSRPGVGGGRRVLLPVGVATTACILNPRRTTAFGEKRGWSWAAADAVQEGRDEDSESVALSAPPDSPGLACWSRRISGTATQYQVSVLLFFVVAAAAAVFVYPTTHSLTHRHPPRPTPSPPLVSYVPHFYPVIRTRRRVLSSSYS